MEVEKIFKEKISKIFFDDSEQIFLILDIKGKIVDINKKGCEILRDKKKNIIGKDWFDNFLPVNIKKEIKVVLKKILSGKLKELKRYENPIIDRKGELKLISWTNNYIKDKKGKIQYVLSSGEDITEKRENKIKLERQLQLFKILFDYAPYGYFMLDFEGNIKDVNNAAEEITGYKKEELIGKNIFKIDLLSKKYFSIALKSISENLKGKAAGPYEYELIRKDGKKIFVDIIARPVNFLGENRILCIARDITQNKEIQKQLEMDSFILKSLLDPIYIYDLNGNIVFYNEILTDIAPINNKNYFEIINPKNGLTFKEIFKQLKSKKKLVYEVEILTKENELRPFEVYASLIKIGKEHKILNIARDLTNRIKAEEEIKNIIQELNQILNSASSALFITNREGIILKVNKKFLDLFELKESEVLGKKCPEIFYIQQYDCFFKNIISGEKIKDVEKNIGIKNGKKIDILINAMPFYDTKGNIVGVIADFKDIRKIKEAEKILQESYNKLKELDALKTTFFSMVSHELKNPLTSIKGFTTLFYKGAAGALNEQQREFVETINNNVERLLNLINELLDMSRIEAGTFSIQKKRNDIIATINNAIKEMQPIAMQKNINLKFINEINEYFLEVDEYRITQVIINILNNAIKFMQNNKNIFINVTIKNKEEIKLPDYVNINLENRKYLLISIKDEGPGINKENLIKIFEKFYQVKQDDMKKGLGLGLFITKAIIDAHHGFIYAESEGEGKGTTFNILL